MALDSSDGTNSLEPTDLGTDASLKFHGWLSKSYSGRCLSLWIADQFEHSPRMRRSKDTLEVSLETVLCGGTMSVFNTAQSLYHEVFSCDPACVLDRALRTFGLSVHQSRLSDGDVTKVNTVFRRLSLKSRWALRVADPVPDNIDLPVLHIYMEVLRAYFHGASRRDELSATEAVERELSLSRSAIESESRSWGPDIAEKHNICVENYILKLLKLKSSAIELLTKLREESIYAVLGLTSSAADSDIKKAYRNLAMQLHPDKGGSKEMFQRLNDAYERILRERGGVAVASSPDEEEAEGPQSEPPPERETCEDTRGEAPASYMQKILKAAEECIQSARAQSENTANLARAEGRHETIGLVLDFVKNMRRCGYAGLELSSAALKLIKDSDCVNSELLSNLTVASGDLMNKSFDLLNTASEIAYSQAADLTVISDSATKAVEVAKTASQAAKFAENILNCSVPSRENIEPTLPLTKHERPFVLVKRLQNAELLRKLNADIVEQQEELRSYAMAKFPDNPWIMEIVRDAISDAIGSTAKRIEANVTIRNSEEMTKLFKSECKLFALFDRRIELAVPVDPLVRCFKLALIKNASVVESVIRAAAVPTLVAWSVKRKRFLSLDAAQDSVLRTLNLSDLYQFELKRVTQSTSLSLDNRETTNSS